MGDLKDPRLIYLKGFLFFLAGAMASAGIIFDQPSLRTIFLLFIAIFCFCRLYYFMFYVIEKYVDSTYRFAGLTSFLIYLLRRKRREKEPAERDKGGER
jgi:hypothetical protein